MPVVAPAAAASAPPIDGVTLEQYAGVGAALIEGFPLPAALENDGLDARAWPSVSMRWSQRLARDGARGPLAVAYADTLGFARGWLGRRVAPLDDDLVAWFGFLGAWSAHPAPFDMLKKLAISPTDVARIQGAWASKIEKDDELRKKSFELAAKKPRAVPALKVTPAALKPFPWTKKRAPEASQAVLVRPKLSTSFVGDAFGMERYASLHAELRLAKKGGAAAALARQGLTEESFAALEARWKTRFTADPTLAEDFRRLARYYEARLGARASRPEGAAPATDLPRGIAPSFAEPAAPVQWIAAPVPADGLTEKQPARLAGTAMVLDLPRGPVMPFAPGSSAGTSAPTPASGVGAAPPAEAAAVKPAPRHLSGTALAVDAPRAPELPFAVPARPGVPVKPNKLAKMSLDLRAARDRKAPAPEPQRASEPPRTPEPRAAALQQQAPALTLEQHASMMVEIAMAPERALEVLGRYRLTPEGKRAVDGHYRERLAASPEAKAAWDRAYQAYYAWLVASRR